MAQIKVTIRMFPWVDPYLELMKNMGCGEIAGAVIAKFIIENGTEVC